MKQKRCGGGGAGGGGGGGGNGFKLQAAASVNEANAAFAFQLSSALAKHWKSVTLECFGKTMENCNNKVQQK